VDTVFDLCLIEINEQANTMVRDLQVGQYLRQVNWEDHIDSLDFDYHLVVYQEIDAKSAVEPNLFVHQGNLNLPFDFESACGQFMLQALLVNAFKQTRPKRLVNLKRGVNNHA
jgi:hypothetical protein